METEDIGELDEADLQLPNGTLIFLRKNWCFGTSLAEVFEIQIDVGLFFFKFLELMGP